MDKHFAQGAELDNRDKIRVKLVKQNPWFCGLANNMSLKNVQNLKNAYQFLFLIIKK